MEPRSWKTEGPSSRPAPRHAAAGLGLKVLKGNRLAHLIGADTDKGLAPRALCQALGADGVPILALGGSPNDLALLEAADVAVVVPRAGGPHEELRPGLQDGATAWRRQHTERDGPTRPCIT